MERETQIINKSEFLPTPEPQNNMANTPETIETRTEGENRQSGRSSRPHKTKGNHRSDTRGVGLKAFFRNNWMKSI